MVRKISQPDVLFFPVSGLGEKICYYTVEIQWYFIPCTRYTYSRT